MVAVAAGKMHTCAALRGGGVLCWGSNEYGQLGLGPLIPGSTVSRSPVELGAFRQKRVTSSTATWFDAGADVSTTAVAYNLQTNGSLQTLPDTNSTPSLWQDNVTTTSIGLGTTATFASTTTQQGDNGESDVFSETEYIWTILVTFKRHLFSGFAVLSLAAGTAHTCALANDYTVWCWGWNGNGQLGIGSTTNKSSPTLVNLPTGS